MPTCTNVSSKYSATLVSPTRDSSWFRDIIEKLKKKSNNKIFKARASSKRQNVSRKVGLTFNKTRQMFVNVKILFLANSLIIHTLRFANDHAMLSADWLNNFFVVGSASLTTTDDVSTVGLVK